MIWEGADIDRDVCPMLIRRILNEGCGPIFRTSFGEQAEAGTGKAKKPGEMVRNLRMVRFLPRFSRLLDMGESEQHPDRMPKS